MKIILFAFIPLILSIGIISVIPFSDADSTIPSSKSNSDAAFTAATFADKYKDMLFTGNRVSVVIKVVGESENTDPAKRAKEIRYLQSYVLKFLSFSNAVNVVSNQQKNEITAQIDTALIPILEQRSDVISVTVLEVQKDGKEYLDKLPPKKQVSQGIEPVAVICNEELVLIIKHSGSPACVRPDTAIILEERGWGVMPPPCSIQCLVYDPVCGIDGITYSCGVEDAACHGVEVKHPGECDDSFDYFEIIILPNTIEQRKNFVVHYTSNSDTTFHFDNQDVIPYQIDGMSDNGNNSFTILIDSTDDWFIDEPPNSYEGVEYIELSASNPDTGEVYDWMNYIIYVQQKLSK